MQRDHAKPARRTVETPSGRIGYSETGSGPAALFVHGGWDRHRLLLGCAAVLLVAVVLPAFVGGYEPVAGAYGLAAALGALGALIAIVGDATPARAAAITAPVALAVTTILPTVSLRLVRVPRPQLALTAPELAQLPGEVDQARTRQQVAAARSLLTGLSSGALGVAAVGIAVLFAEPTGWSRSLACVLAALMVLRSRLFAARAPVIASVVATALTLVALLGIALVDTSDERGLLGVLAPVAAVLGIATLTVGATAGRWTASPRMRRLVDIAETLMLVSVAPLILGVWHVYSTVFDLKR